MPSFDSGKNFIGIGGPFKGFGLLIMFENEAVDSALKINDRLKHTAFQAFFGEFGEETLDGIEP